jgi:hypothetical protein
MLLNLSICQLNLRPFIRPDYFLMENLGSMVMEITRDSMNQLMHDRPELVSYLAGILEVRQAKTAEKLAKAYQIEEDHESIFDQMISRIKVFFGLGKSRGNIES